jgi:hypothetical protein
MSGFPFQLKGACCYNFLFSPNFERFLDFDYEASQIVIRQTKNEQIIQRIPTQLMNLNLLGHIKSIKNISTIGSRIMFNSENEIRVLNQDCLDIKLTFDDKGFKIKSFVALDNFNLLDHSDPHVFLERKVLPKDQTLKRLIRKNA